MDEPPVSAGGLIVQSLCGRGDRFESRSSADHLGHLAAGAGSFRSALPADAPDRRGIDEGLVAGGGCCPHARKSALASVLGWKDRARQPPKGPGLVRSATPTETGHAPRER